MGQCLGNARMYIRNSSEPPPLLIRYDLTDVTCFGEATGSAEAVAAGGTPFYTLEWETNAGFQTGTSAINLTAGQHVVTLQDNNSCKLVDTITINQRGGLFDINDKESLWYGKNLYELYNEAHTPWEWHKDIFDYAKTSLKPDAEVEKLIKDFNMKLKGF